MASTGGSTTGNPKRVRALTRYYSFLQSLTKVPLGVLFLLIGVTNAGWWEWFEIWKPISDLSAFVLVFVFWWLLGLYYRRNFGYVRSSQVEVIGNTKVVLTGLAVSMAILTVLLVDVFVAPPVSMVGMFFVAGMLWIWVKLGSLGAHYAMMAVLLATVSLLPLTGLVSPEEQFSVVTPLAVGLILIVGGVLDHLTLRRNLPPVSEENDGGAV